MDKATYEREMTLNRDAYRNIGPQIRAKYKGQYVVLAHGDIIASAATFDAAQAAIQRHRPIPEYYLIFPADVEPAFDLVYDVCEA